MRNFNVFLLSIFAAQLCGAKDSPRIISNHEMLQAPQKSSIRPLKRDDYIEDNEKLKYSQMKETLQKQKSFIVSGDDFDACKSENALLQYYSSKDLSDAVRLARSFKCESIGYSVMVEYWIYKDATVAKKGQKWGQIFIIDQGYALDSTDPKRLQCRLMLAC